MFWLNLGLFFLSQMRPVAVVNEYASDPIAFLPPPSPAQVYPQPMPVMMPQVSAAKAFNVEVRFVGGTKNQFPPASMLMLLESQKGVVSTAWKEGNEARYYNLEANLKKVTGSDAELDLCLTCSGAKCCCCKLACKLPLGKKNNVVFQGDCPEPCCAEVTVTEAKPMPAPYPVATTYGPQMSCPASPIVQCGGPGMPCCPAPMVMPRSDVCYMPPEPVGYPMAQAIPCMPPPTPMQLCTGTTTTKSTTQTSHFTIVREGEKSRVQMAGPKTRVVSSRFEVECGEAGKLTFGAGKTCVLVTGATWKAQARSIEIRDDGVVTLRGHVLLTSDHIGSGASVKAEDICVKVTRGTFEKILGKASTTKPTPVQVYEVIR